MEGGDSDSNSCHRRTLSYDIAVDMSGVENDESELEWFKNRRKMSALAGNKATNVSSNFFITTRSALLYI